MNGLSPMFLIVIATGVVALFVIFFLFIQRYKR